MVLFGDGDEIPLDWLGRLPALRLLALEHHDVSADGWRSLANSTIDQVSLTASTIHPIPTPKGQIRELYLSEMNLTPQFGTALLEHPLEEVVIRTCKSALGFWQTLSSHATIRELELEDTIVEEQMLEQIVKLPGLERLEFSADKTESLSLSSVQIEQLGQLKNLRELWCPRLDVPDGKCWERVAQIPGLQKLDVRGCPIGDATVAELIESPSLETLWLNDTRITDTSLKHLAELSTLKQLSISGSPDITDSGREWFSNARPDVTFYR